MSLRIEPHFLAVILDPASPGSETTAAADSWQILFKYFHGSDIPPTIYQAQFHQFLYFGHQLRHMRHHQLPFFCDARLIDVAQRL